MKKLLAIIAVVALTASLAYAAGETSNAGWWSSLKTKIEKLASGGSSTATTAVGGVRGAKDEGESAYWKGKDKTQQGIAREELDSFNLAVDQAINGKAADSIASFESFIQKYPDSVLAGDAKEALVQLKGAK